MHENSLTNYYEEIIKIDWSEVKYDTPGKIKKRIAIAKDVVRRLRYLRVFHNYKYVGGYFNFISKEAIQPETELQPFVHKMEKYCRVCALGACFLSHIRLFNNFKYNSNNNYLRQSDMFSSLKDYFNISQLLSIEYAFEFRGGEWIKKYPHAKTRLRAIMLNIIKNKGTFVSNLI